METSASTTEPSAEPDLPTRHARLHRYPVHGSVATRLLPSQPQPRAAWACLLPVSRRSPAKARADTEMFLSRCPSTPDGLGDDAVLIVSELVTNAYTAMETGPLSGIARIDLSLRLFGDYLLIEVIDSSPNPPAPDFDANAIAVGGRGLAVVDSLSGHQWGYFWRVGRKVVFCKLSVDRLQRGEGMT